MAKVYGLSQSALFYRVTLPGALPSILVGLRYSLGIMWLTLIVAETISASAGIGYMTMNAREFLQTDVVLLGVLIYAALGKIADVLTRALESRALAWHPSYQTPGRGLSMRFGALILERAPRRGTFRFAGGANTSHIARDSAPVQTAEHARSIEGLSLDLRSVTKSSAGARS